MKKHGFSMKMLYFWQETTKKNMSINSKFDKTERLFSEVMKSWKKRELVGRDKPIRNLSTPFLWKTWKLVGVYSGKVRRGERKGRGKQSSKCWWNQCQTVSAKLRQIWKRKKRKRVKYLTKVGPNKGLLIPNTGDHS